MEPFTDVSCVVPPAEKTFCEFIGVSTHLTQAQKAERQLARQTCLTSYLMMSGICFSPCWRHHRSIMWHWKGAWIRKASTLSAHTNSWQPHSTLWNLYMVLFLVQAVWKCWDWLPLFTTKSSSCVICGKGKHLPFLCAVVQHVCSISLITKLHRPSPWFIWLPNLLKNEHNKKGLWTISLVKCHC